MIRRRLGSSLVMLLFGTLPAAAKDLWPWFEGGGDYLQRDGFPGARLQARVWPQEPATGISFSAETELTMQPVIAYAASARYRLGEDHCGVWPLLGWRGWHNGSFRPANADSRLYTVNGPEVGLGGEIGFGPGTAFLRAEAGLTQDVLGSFAQCYSLRLRTRYRVWQPLDLEAGYRFEYLGSTLGFSHVWSLGANFVM